MKIFVMSMLLWLVATIVGMEIAGAQTVVMGADGKPVTIEMAVSDPQPVDNSLVGLIVAIVFGINALLFGLYNALGYIKDKTTTQVDNRIYAFLGGVLGWLQKLIEVVGPVTAVKVASAVPPEDKQKPT